MKIASYQIDAARVPFDQALSGTHVILRIRTDEGLEGISYVSRVQPSAVKGVVSVAEGYMQQITGDDAMNIEAINGKLFRRGGGLPGYQERASSLIDSALWDLKGKALGQPVWRLMGGFRDRVPTYASWRIEPGTERNTEDVSKSAAYLVEQGFTAMKWHTGALSKEAVVNHMRILRETVGDDVEIMVDVNQRWTPKQAVNIGQALEEYRPYWIEEPVLMDDYEGLRQVTDSLETLTCGGEVYRSIHLFRKLLEARAIDVAMVDLDVGLTGFLKVAHMAETFGIPVVTHLATEVMMHVVAAVPNGLTTEYYPWAIPIFPGSLQLEDGELVMSEKPGLGLELDDAALARYALS